MKKPRVGRPRAKLKATVEPVTRRVRRLIDLAHDGNVQEASKATRLPYATIRDLYLGRSTNPNHKTIRALVDTYCVYDGWFTDETQAEEVPAGGWSAYVDGFIKNSAIRETIIPFSAWPLGNLCRQLADTLEARPASASRPIIGSAQAEREVTLRLSNFLLGPILSAERATSLELILHLNSPNWHQRKAQEMWIHRLRLLGRYWEDVFPEMISAIREGTADQSCRVKATD